MKTDKEEKQASQQNDDEQKPRRTMLRFEREGFVIPVWGILTIEKDFEIEQSATGKISSVHNIIINKGMEIGTPQCPIGERKATYYDADERDKAYKRMLGILEASGVEFIQLN